MEIQDLITVQVCKLTGSSLNTLEVELKLIQHDLPSFLLFEQQNLAQAWTP